jgi:hypothetical protein
LLGLHTGYELDRVGGRYDLVQDEQGKPRTIFPLRPERAVDVLLCAVIPAPPGGRAVRSGTLSAPSAWPVR